ncbi:hypothetical protein ACTWQF_29135 [Streptomyces sp. 8N114]|uniref:hypothetical protein n=1 Tax=Streptomyces sp. 8N114 TaxID=3457419 RepID=UPI003FD66D7F
MPLQTPPLARHQVRARAHGAAVPLAAVLVLLLTLLALGCPHLAADERGCADGRTPVAAADSTSCHQVDMATPPSGHHHGHGSSAKVCPATSTSPRLCHVPLAAVHSPPASSLLTVPAGAADPVPGTAADCHPRATQRQILRC